jgi:hypothetical protein
MLKGIVSPLPQFFKKCFKDSSRASLTTIIIILSQRTWYLSLQNILSLAQQHSAPEGLS